MRTVLLLTAVGLMLAGCDLVNAPTKPAEPGAGETVATPAQNAAFSYTASEDISGYYRPSGMTGADDFEVAQVFIGQPQDFDAWGKGERGGSFAPVMMEFSVVGGETLRVLPERYSVSDGRVSMQGTAPGVGEVSFDARLDKGALATARRNLGGSEAAAMTGSVRVGRQTVSGVKFVWYGGD